MKAKSLIAACAVLAATIGAAEAKPMMMHHHHPMMMHHRHPMMMRHMMRHPMMHHHHGMMHRAM